jgi:hypothetical protein
MQLGVHNVTVKSKHVVDPLVFKAFDIDCLILSKFDQVSDLMVFWNHVNVHIRKADVKGIKTNVISALFHANNINFAQSIPCFETHQIVQGF